MDGHSCCGRPRRRRVNLLSRSWIRRRPLEQPVEVRLRACCATRAGRVGRAPARCTLCFELDEEEDVVAAQRECLDGEEIAGSMLAACWRRKTAAVGRSAGAGSSLRRGGSPDRAGRDGYADVEQLSRRCGGAPARVLRRGAGRAPDVLLDRRRPALRRDAPFRGGEFACQRSSVLRVTSSP